MKFFVKNVGISVDYRYEICVCHRMSSLFIGRLFAKWVDCLL